jgi:hypothetical protein
MNRANNGQVLDANSHDTLSFVASTGIYITNTTTTIAGSGPGVFHGFLVVSAPAGSYTLTLYDASTTSAAGLITSTTVGVLATTTAAGALPFQWGGDIIYSNGLVAVASGGTTGNVRILYL